MGGLVAIDSFSPSLFTVFAEALAILWFPDVGPSFTDHEKMICLIKFKGSRKFHLLTIHIQFPHFIKA